MEKPLQALLSILILLFALNLNAQTISGKVTNSIGEPIAGVNILGKGTSKNTLTDKEGTYILKVEEGTTILLFEYLGYQTAEVKIKTQTMIDITLTKGLEIDDMAVSASRKLEQITTSPATTVILTGKEMESQAVSIGDPTNLLKNSTGVSIIQNGINKSTITLRGRSIRNSTQTLVMKDNRILNDFNTSNYDSERSPIVPIDIERIEIIRGAATLWGSGASAGVIHYISKDPFQYSGVSAEVSYGNSFGDERIGQAADITKVDLRYAGHLKDKLGWKVVGSYRTGNDFVFDVTDDRNNLFGPGSQRMTDYTTSAISGMGNEVTKDGQWTDYSTTLNTLDMNGDSTGFTREQGGGPFNLIPAFHSINLEGTLEYKPTDNISIALVPSFGQSKGNFSNDDLLLYEFKAQFNTQLRINAGKFFASANYRTMPGFDGDLNNAGWEAQYNTTSWGDAGTSQYIDFQAQYPIKIGEKTDIIVGGDMRTMKKKFVQTFPNGKKNILKESGTFENERYTTIGGYTEMTHQFSDKIKAVAAFRVDNFTVYGTAFSPKAGLVYNPKSGTAFRLSYNQSNTAPSMRQTYYQTTVNNRNQNINGNLSRYFYGSGGEVTFNNPMTGLIVDPNNLGFYFDGTDISLQTVLDYMIATTNFTAVNSLAGSVIEGTSTGTLYSLDNLEENVLIEDLTTLNTPKVTFETTHSIEAGYKGLLLENLSISVDAYYNIGRNLQTNATTLAAKVEFETIGEDLEAALLAMGVDANKARTVKNRTNRAFTDIDGIIISDQHQALGLTNGIAYGFKTFDQIQYFGVDFAFDFYVNEDISLYTNWSYINKTEFISEDGNEKYYLNTPKNRVRGGMNYGGNRTKGFFGNFAVQYNGAFYVDYGTLSGEMTASTTLDVMVGYKINNDLSVLFSGLNIMNTEMRSMPYLPVQGAMFMGTVRYNLGAK